MHAEAERRPNTETRRERDKMTRTRSMFARAVAACLLISLAHAVPTPRAAGGVQLSTEDLAQGQATTPLPDLDDIIILSSTSRTEFSSEFFARGIAWHKSGSVMMRESLNAINDYLASLLKGGAIVAAPGVSSTDVRVGIVIRRDSNAAF